MAAAFHIYKTSELQYYLTDATKRIGSLEETSNSFVSSSSTQQASISSICEKVRIYFSLTESYELKFNERILKLNLTKL